jgi:Tfp pilus assembly protein PilF
MAKRIVLILLLGLAASPVAAKPYLPTTADQVLEELPVLGGQTDAELRGLQQALNADPTNRALAVKVASHLLEIARVEAEPRYYGYAEAAVKTWWQQPTADVLLIRATIRQHQHDFGGALADLHEVLIDQPNNVQAWLTQAVIQSVQGDYQTSIRSCLMLKRLMPGLVATTCLSHAASLNGSGRQAYQLLRKAYTDHPNADPATRLWALTVLAEIAARQGDDQAAHGHFLQALALSKHDVYLLSAYCDFLLDQHQPNEVIALLNNHTQPDALLLRLALAEQAVGAAPLNQHIDTLKQRIEAYRLRGESFHQREQARFMLNLAKQPQTALTLALANWQVQREPWDARLVLEAALAAGDTDAARPVLAWLRQVNLADKPLQATIQQLETQG